MKEATVDVRVVIEVEHAWDFRKACYDRSKPIGTRYVVDQWGAGGRDYMIGAPIGTGRSREQALADFCERAGVEYNYCVRKTDPTHQDIKLVANVVKTEDRRTN